MALPLGAAMARGARLTSCNRTIVYTMVMIGRRLVADITADCVTTDGT